MTTPSFSWLILALVSHLCRLSSLSTSLSSRELASQLRDDICLLLATGNILNFNVGSTVDLSVPRSFWSRLAGKYGNIFYWREKVDFCFARLFAVPWPSLPHHTLVLMLPALQGEDASIEAAVSAIGACLREPPGAFACSEIQ